MEDIHVVHEQGMIHATLFALMGKEEKITNGTSTIHQ